MSAYYNEIDPYAAQWLRNLIAAGHIAPGEVDERSISDVKPDDLRPFTQCHFFAGLGGWSAALRRAGWPDDRRVWTASCPCQPFSQAGAGAGMADERHLWPDFYWLAMQLSPGEIFGEQVASKDAEPWLDLVQTDLEGLGYAFGAIAFPSAGIGAPHIRDRTYWVAHADGGTCEQGGSHIRGRVAGSDAQPWAGFGGGCVSDRVGHTDDPRLEGGPFGASGERAAVATAGLSGGLADTDGRDAGAEREQHGRQLGLHSEDGSDVRPEYRGARVEPPGRLERAGPVNGLWANADWLFCRDGKWRPVEPGTFPLADGAPARVGRLRAYGNAINVEAAAQFIAAYMEVAP